MSGPNGRRWSRFAPMSGRGAGLLLLCFATLVAPASAVDFTQARDLFRSGKYAECIAEAGKGVDAQAWNEDFRVLKLRAQLELGRYADALQSLDESLQKVPASVQLRWIGRDVRRFNGQADKVVVLEKEIESLVNGSAWRYGDAVNQMTLAEFFLQQRIDPKRVLDTFYMEVRRRQPTFAPAWIASGELALEKHDYALAAQAFAQAAKLDADDPESHFGLARAFLPSDSEKAQAALEATLAKNPNHVRCLLLIADEQIDAEQYPKAVETLDRIAKINPHLPLMHAYRAVLAHLQNQPEGEQKHREAALKFWAANPEVDHLIGRKLSQEYRFAEGATYQRQALKFDPGYCPARMQLAQDLLRLGEEAEGWKLAGEAYDDDGYNVVAHNLVALRENLEKFRTLEEDGFVLRMDAREAEIYGRRVLALLKRARKKLCGKYAVTIERPVIVEMFPRQQDFAIRTFGLPGGAGFLGVCFGSVITANSPASQGEHPTCWEATLWHEFCHVVTLHKTHNRMPRWLSEGISVHEELQENPTWGQTINPKYRQMILGDDLVAVSELSGAFLKPPTPLHLQFAYYESSLVVRYLIETHGLETLQEILTDLGAGVPINEALDRHAGGLHALDDGFAAYARKLAQDMAPEADWSEPELPRRADSKTISAWLKDHPRNYAALQRLAGSLIAEKRFAEAQVPVETMRKLYPQDTASLTLLARISRELKENAAERMVLEELAKLTDDDVDVYSRLTDLTAQAGDWSLTRDYALRWLAVNPLQAAPHRRAAEAAEKLGDTLLATESLEALLQLDPLDPAELHLRLAKLHQKSGDLPQARRHVLLALEDAPRYRAAHKLLLEIARDLPEKTDKPGAKPASPPAPADSMPVPEVRP